MLKPLRFKGQETDFFFIGCLHWGHNRDFIYTKRRGLDGNAYTSVTEHDEGVVHAWNSVCTDRSTVISLGDTVFADPDGERFWTLMRRLQFAYHGVMTGNHTSGQRQAYIQSLRAQYPSAVNDKGEIIHEVYPLVVPLDGNPNKLVVFLPQYVEAHVNSTQLVLCHYPVLSHNSIGHGSIHLCSHSHGSCALTNKDTGEGLRLDVGVESFGRPLNLKEIKYHLRNRTTDSYDHHDHKTT